MKNIAIQAGHWNIQNNCELTLRGGTGAPKEVETNKRIAVRLEQILQSKGFSTHLFDANHNCDSNSDAIDWDLYISLHCDQNYVGNEGGGFVDVPEPSTDFAHDESERIKQAIEQTYFQESGIINVPARRNNNTRYYYMWNELSARTPCVILEMGESIDPHDNVILSDTERVAQAIAKGIFRAFPEVVTPTEPPKPVDPCQSLKDENTKLIMTVSSLSEKLTNSEAELARATQRLESYKNFVKELKERIISL